MLFSGVKNPLGDLELQPESTWILETEACLNRCFGGDLPVIEVDLRCDVLVPLLEVGTSTRLR